MLPVVGEGLESLLATGSCPCRIHMNKYCNLDFSWSLFSLHGLSLHFYAYNCHSWLYLLDGLLAICQVIDVFGWWTAVGDDFIQNTVYLESILAI